MTDVQASTGTRDTGVVDRDNPWPGLAAFRESDQAFFHGREAAIDALIELVTRARISVLYGASGLGKTSLIQAGLFPRARARDLLPVRIRLRIADPRDNPSEQVAAALRRAADEHRIEAPARDPAETLWEFFYRKDSLWWSERHHIVTPLLVFDQFEEIFTTGRANAATAEAAQQFLEDLRGIVLGFPPDTVKARCDANPDEALRFSLARCPVRVLFSFREDYLAEFLELRDLFPAVGENDHRLLRMSKDDAMRVVLNAGGHLVDPPVARHIVEIIAAGRGAGRRPTGDLAVDPALLSVFCRELNNERRSLGHDKITEELLKDKQAKILDNFYLRSLEGLDPRVRTFIEDELILPDSPERNSVAEQVALRRPGVTVEAIESLIDRRLLRRDERDGPARLELTHDVLIEPVRASRDLRRLREDADRRLADQRDAEEKKRQTLKAQHDALQRRRVLNIFGLVTALAILAAALIYQENQRTKRALAFAGLVQASTKYGAEGRNDIALAYLAYAVERDADNDYARGKLVDFLLRRTWPLPLAIMRHDGPVQWAEFSPDGKQVLTRASDSSGVRLWSVTSQPQPERLFATPMLLVRFDRQGRYVIAVSAAGDAEIWDSRDRRTLWQAVADDYDPITVAALSRAASVVAAGAESGAVRLWSIDGKQQTPRQPMRHTGRIATLQFDESASRLLSSSADGTARIWDTRTGAELARFEDPGIITAQFAPDGAYVATTSLDRRAKVWDLRRARRAGRPVPMRVLTHEAAVRSAQFSPDGKRIVTASDDGTAQVWNLLSADVHAADVNAAAGPLATAAHEGSEEGGKQGTALQHRLAVLTAVFSADGTRVVTASRDKSARVWDAESGTPLTEPMWHDREVESATFSPDGERVVTASADGTAVVWDVRAGIALPAVLRIADTPLTAEFSPNGRYVLVGSDSPSAAQGWARVWDTETGAVSNPVSHAVGVPPEFSRDGESFVTVHEATAQRHHTASGELAGPPMTHASTVLLARVSPDGQRIATLARDGHIRLWDARTASPIEPSLRTRPGDRGPEINFSSFAFSSDSKMLASGASLTGNNGFCAVWDLSATVPKLISVFKAPGPVESVSISPDNQWLLAVVANAGLVWHLPDMKLGDPLSHDTTVFSARFSPDGHRIVTASDDATAKLWRHPPGQAIPAILRHGKPVDWADFSPDGLRILTTSRDGTARLWDARAGDAASLPLVHGAGGYVFMGRFSADSRRVVTVAEDRRIRVWNVPVGAASDVSALASLAEAVSGYEVQHGDDDENLLVRLDPIARLDAERQHVEASRGSGTLPQRLAEWFLADRWKRTISPFSTTTIEAYVNDRLSDQSDDSRREVMRVYPGYPALRAATAGQH